MWREQYDRMRRWHWRLWLDVEHVLGGNQVTIDVFYAFAQTCAHLVDWLENDHSQPIRRRQAEAWIAGSPALSFCADVCNGSKHARLTQKRITVSSKRTTLGSFEYENESGETVKEVVEAPETFIEWNGQQIDVASFALKCIDEWNRRLADEGLLSKDEGLTPPSRSAQQGRGGLSE